MLLLDLPLEKIQSLKIHAVLTFVSISQSLLEYVMYTIKS